MRSLVRTEWLKLKNYLPFWVLFGGYLLAVSAVIAIALVIHYESMQQRAMAEALTSHPVFSYPEAWQTVAYIASWLQFLPATLIILNVCNEFTYRTHRQNLLDGWSRSQFVLAKLLLVSGLSLAAALLVGVLTLVAAGMNGFLPSPEGVEALAAFWLQTMVYTMFALSMGVFIRRAALALAAFLMVTTVGNLVAVVLQVKLKQLAFVLPFRAANTLVPGPYYHESTQKLFETPAQPILVGISVAYVLFFAGAVWLQFNREDL
jgi:ABC-2 type transport system permease protein